MITVGELAVAFGLTPTGWDKGDKLVKNLAATARRLLGVEAVRSVAGFVEHTTEAANHLVSFSQAMGLTVEQTQEWGYVAQQSGSNLRELAVGFGMAERNLRTFAEGRGGNALRATMREAGISLEDARRALASPDGMNALLLKTSDRFKEMGNSGQRAALGQALFGARAGRAVVADMARGADAIRQLMDRRRSFGELSGEQAVGLRDLGNRIQDLKLSFTALATQVLGTIAPALTEMASAAARWIAAHRELLSGAILVALRAVEFVFLRIADVITVVADIFQRAFGGDVSAIGLLTGLAFVISDALIPALYGMIEPMVMAIASMGPLFAVGTAIGVALGLIIKYGPQIADALGSAWEFVTEKASDFWDFIKGIPGAIEDGFVAAWDAIKDAAESALEYVADLPVIKQLIEVYKYFTRAATPEETAAAEQVYQQATHAGGIFGLAGHTYDAEVPASTESSPPAAAGASGASISVGPTSIQINVGSVDEAKQAKQAFDDDRSDMIRRHALRGVGGEVK